MPAEQTFQVVELDTRRVLATHDSPHAALSWFKDLPDSVKRTAFVRVTPLTLDEAKRQAVAKLEREYA